MHSCRFNLVPAPLVTILVKIVAIFYRRVKVLLQFVSITITLSCTIHDILVVLKIVVLVKLFEPDAVPCGAS
jgi:hypothetical protein